MQNSRWGNAINAAWGMKNKDGEGGIRCSFRLPSSSLPPEQHREASLWWFMQAVHVRADALGMQMQLTVDDIYRGVTQPWHAGRKGFERIALV